MKEEDFEHALISGLRALLFSCADGQTDPDVLAYLSRFRSEDRQKNKTFTKRPCWSQPQEGIIPDAFMTYMVKDGPRIAFNNCLVNSTNTVHRIYFKQNVLEVERYLTALALMSSYAQLSAEFECRTYGSGVLKVEPSEAARIRVPKMPEMTKRKAVNLMASIDTLLRAGQANKAVNIIDTLVIKHNPKLKNDLGIAEVQQAIAEARARRFYKLPAQPVQKVRSK